MFLCQCQENQVTVGGSNCFVFICKFINENRFEKLHWLLPWVWENHWTRVYVSSQLQSQTVSLWVTLILKQPNGQDKKTNPEYLHHSSKDTGVRGHMLWQQTSWFQDHVLNPVRSKQTGMSVVKPCILTAKQKGGGEGRQGGRDGGEGVMPRAKCTVYSGVSGVRTKDTRSCWIESLTEQTRCTAWMNTGHASWAELSFLNSSMYST